jgi:hypothetical protein
MSFSIVNRGGATRRTGWESNNYTVNKKTQNNIIILVEYLVKPQVNVRIK